MIKFFRNIRKSLLTENRFNKYLLYAIGEIILVVIGILIALQINNWNQNRLERNEEKVILQNLKEDYKSAVEEFKWLNTIRNQIITSAEKITAIKPNEVENYQTTYLDSLFSQTLFAPTFNNESGSLNVLLTSGKINLISNEDLKNKLIAWPGDVSDMIEDEIAHSDMYFGAYTEILENFLSWNDLLKHRTMPAARFKKIQLQLMPDNPVVSSDYFALLNNKRFLNLLSRRASICNISNNETEDLIEKAEGIIKLIDEEIKN